VALADALADVEPEDDLGGHQGVKPGLANGEVLVGAGLGSLEDIAESLTDGRNVGRRRGRQLHLGVLQEHVQLWPRLSKEPCENDHYIILRLVGADLVTKNRWPSSHDTYCSQVLIPW